MRLYCPVCLPTRLRVPFFLRQGAHFSRLIAACLALLGLFGLAGSLSAQVSTTTTLAVTNTSSQPVTSVASGTVVVLTASVTQTSGGSNVTKGLVNFCDANATHCGDIHLIGSAQVRSNGTAVFKFRPAPGAHSYYAAFTGTTANAASNSTTGTLTVTSGPFSTTTSIAQSGSAGNYLLTATVRSVGASAPPMTGTLQFLDTTNNNYVLATPTIANLITRPSYFPYVSYGTGKYPEGVAVADLNQDGIPDLVTIDDANTGASSNFVSVLFGNADGTFQSAVSYAGSVNNADAPVTVTTADVNGDGYPDVVVIGSASNCCGVPTVYVYLNDGKGNLTGPNTYTFNYPDNVGGGSPMGLVGGVAIGDVNQDGKPDIVLTFPGDQVYGAQCGGYCSAIGVMLGNGDGTFQMGNTSNSPPWVPVYESGFQVQQNQYFNPIVLADLRGIGKLDAVMSNLEDSNAVCVALGNGDGGFAAPNCYSANAGGSLAVGDVNEDGIPDVVVGSSGGNEVDVLLGNGDGSFQSAVPYTGGNGPTGLVLTDINADGHLDVVTTNGDGTVSALLGSGQGTFGDFLSTSGGASYFSFESLGVADFVGGGMPGLVTVDTQDALVNVLLATWTRTASATASGVSPVGPVSASDSVTASYSGDSYYVASTSAPVSLTDQPVPTTLNLQSNTLSTTVGSKITLTATLSPYDMQSHSTDGETITFLNNGNSVGTATLSGGVATLQLPIFTSAQTNSYTASYSTDQNFLASSSSAVTVTVQKVSTTLSVQTCVLFGENTICGVPGMTYGSTVQVVATLSPYSVAGVTSSDGESVTFYNNGSSIGTAPLSLGTATLTLSEPIVGSYSFTVQYLGDVALDPSTTAAAAPLTVNQATSNLGLMVTPSSTTTYGRQVILNAQFLPNAATSDSVNGETITFNNNGSPIGTATLAGLNAQLILNNLAVGPYNFSAQYSGDQNFTSSYSSPVGLNVQLDPTALVLSATPSGSTQYGSPVFLQAYLSPSGVGGGGNSTNGESLVFLDNGTPIGSGTLSNGVATLNIPVPASGFHNYGAIYSGDASFASSNAAPAQVNVTPVQTMLGISTTTPSTIATGGSVALSANLYPYSVSGGASTTNESVTFLDNANPVGTGMLAANGIATFQANNVSAGTHNYTASYPGDGNFRPASSSNAITITALPATTLTLTTSPANFAALNQPITLTATLSPDSFNGNSTNGETIYFRNDGTDIESAPLSNGVATFTFTNGLPEGAYSFTAVYLSDGIRSGSTSSPVAFSVATTENYVVNTTSDDAGSASACSPQSSSTQNSTDSACSLRDALLAAAAAPEGANVTFDNTVFTAAKLLTNPAANTISLTNGTLTVTSNTTLTGPTAGSGGMLTNLVTVNGGGSTAVQTFTDFNVTGTGAAINNLIITGGFPTWNNDNPYSGGGIVNSGSLTLTYSEITGNGSFANGGGIYNTGTLTVIGSTIDNNQSGYDGIGNGGGIDSENSGALTIVNSTIANNTANGNPGGGIEIGSGTLTMTNSTVSGNRGNAGGINNAGGTVTLANSIVSGNFRAFYSDFGGTYIDQGGNNVGYYANGTEVNDPHLLTLTALGFYGGPTPTMVPLPDSSAICAATYTNSPSQWSTNQIDIDQRGFPNYNISYSQLANTGSPLPAVCYDSGAVQTNYTAVQFGQSNYVGGAGGAVTPAVVVAVTENGQNLGGVPLNLSYSGPGTLSNSAATTAEGAGASFSGLSVDTSGSGALGARITVAGSSYISGTANLSVLAPLQISPGSETIPVGPSAPFSQSFTVSGGSGSYQLSSTSTLPSGVTLSPSGTASGSSWTLSGTPTQTGSFNFSLTATDASDSSVTTTQNFTLVIAPPSTLTLVASPTSFAAYGQTVTLTATVSPSTATGVVTFFDGGNPLGSGPVALSGGSPNTATLALNASTLGSSLALGAHSFTAQYSGDAADSPSTSNTVSYSVTPLNFVVNTTADDNGAYTCTQLASATSNTTDGNNGGNPGLCTLRDALNSAGAIGGATIYFDTSVFAASNLIGNPSANTIYVNVPANGGSLGLPSNTVVQGLTSGSGATLKNLVTIDGGGSSLGNNGTTIVVGGSGAAMVSLNINNGYASGGGNGGAITNFGQVTISGVSFTGNQASASGGAIFNVGGSVTVLDSTFSANSAQGGNGGAMDNSDFSNCGVISVADSTFNQNSAFSGSFGDGGALNNDPGGCVLNVTGSTIAGNSTDNLFGLGGGGIFNASGLYLANNIIFGNTNGYSSGDDLFDGGIGGNFYDGANVVSGNLIGVYNGAASNAGNIVLAPLGNYGGPTQTMLPLPGSSAICAGLAADIAPGVTTDQRGMPNTNITYPGFSNSAPCVDAGAVQTNFSLAFTAQPAPILPAVSIEAGANFQAAVTVYESGSPEAPGIAVPLALSGSGTLANGSATTSSGIAAYTGLQVTAAGTGDTLTASLALNGSLIISATSSPFTVTAAQPPVGWMFPVKDATTGGTTTVGQSDNFIVTGAAGDPNDGTPVAQVQILVDGSPAGTATLGLASSGLEARYSNPAYAHGGWSYTAAAAGLSAGTHTVSAVATDSLGLSTTLGSETFMVSTASSGPPVGWMFPVKDATTGGTTAVAQADNLVVGGAAGDPHDGTPVQQVQILIDGSVAGNATLGLASTGLQAAYNNPAYANGGWTFTASASGLSAGSHTISAVASDSLGLTTTLGTEAFVVATVSSGPPVGWMFPVKDATTGGTNAVGQGDNLTVSGTAGDPHDGTPVHQVQILIDGSVAGNATLGLASTGLEAAYNNPAYGSGGWTFTATASGLSAGSHTISAVASDSLGLSTILGTETFVVSTVSSGPPVGWMFPVKDATTGGTNAVGQGDNLTVSGTAGDPHDGTPVAQVQILIDGSPAGTATLGLASTGLEAAYNNPAYANGGWTFTSPSAGLTPGTHTATAIATDSLGLSTTLGTETFTVAATSSGPPVGWMFPVKDAATGSTTTIARSDNFIVSGAAGDPHDGTPVAQVQILIDGNVAGTATLGLASPGLEAVYDNPAYANGGWTFTSAAAGLSPGTHTLSAVAIDSLSLATTLGTETITVTN